MNMLAARILGEAMMSRIASHVRFAGLVAWFGWRLSRRHVYPGCYRDWTPHEFSPETDRFLPSGLRGRQRQRCVRMRFSAMQGAMLMTRMIIVQRILSMYRSRASEERTVLTGALRSRRARVVGMPGHKHCGPVQTLAHARGSVQKTGLRPNF